jgi:GNAT superfamily N-acetyltransferase
LRVKLPASHASQDHATDIRGGDPQKSELRSPLVPERPALYKWLNDGLRPGKPNRLQQEFPTALEDPDFGLHSIVTVEGQFASHAFARVVDVCADGCTLPFGMIGLVYTDPDFRGNGYASRCVSRCLDGLRERNIPLAGLWSDQPDFYRRLGFEPGGQEIWFSVSAEDCARVRAGSGNGLHVGLPREKDWTALESLYNEKPLRALRRPGELRRLASAPETRLVVAREGDRVLAYAAMGRGDDFPGAVHEWAGEASAVAACLEALIDRGGAVGWLTGPIPERTVEQFQMAGAVPVPGHFALLHLLDATRVWREIHKNPSDADNCRLSGTSDPFLLSTPEAEIELTHLETLRLIFGPTAPKRTQPLISRATGCGGSNPLPWPLFVWGFDSN